MLITHEINLGQDGDGWECFVDKQMLHKYPAHKKNECGELSGKGYFKGQPLIATSKLS